jgi:hypothetical protein
MHVAHLPQTYSCAIPTHKMNSPPERPFSYYLHSHRLAAEMWTKTKKNFLGKKIEMFLNIYKWPTWCHFILLFYLKQLDMFRAYLAHQQEIVWCFCIYRFLLPVSPRWILGSCRVVLNEITKQSDIKLDTYIYYFMMHGTMNLKFIGLFLVSNSSSSSGA